MATDHSGYPHTQGQVRSYRSPLSNFLPIFPKQTALQNSTLAAHVTTPMLSYVNPNLLSPSGSSCMIISEVPAVLDLLLRCASAGFERRVG